ncbi:MAG: TolC family protein [Fibrobacter sp.]|nr:TolC family protein [Fibrobacter sp.]
MSRQLTISAPLAFTIALGMACQAFAGQVYTREDAIRIAMEKSSDIKTAEEDLISANSQVEGGYGNAYPSVDLSATVTRIFGMKDVKPFTQMTEAYDRYHPNGWMVNPDGTPMVGPDGNPMVDPSGNPLPTDYDGIVAAALDKSTTQALQQAYRWQSNVNLSVTQVLYAAGKVGVGIDIAKTAKRLQEVNLENTKAKVRYDVESAFNQLLFLDSALAIQQATIELTQTNLDFVEQSLKSGMATELDLIRVQLALDGYKSDLEKTKKSQVLARNALLNSMGLGFDAEATFVGEFLNPEEAITYPDTSMANVKKRRKELLMLEETETMLNKNIEIEEGGYKPTIVLGGQIGYKNLQNEFYKWDAPRWSKLTKAAFLSLNMNLFNGMQTKEKIVQAKSKLRSTQVQKDAAERGFRLQIESCANTFEDAIQQLEIQKRQVELATKNYDLTEAAFKLGRETQLNLLSANMSLRAAKLNYMQAVLNWNNALLALRQATGEY